MFLTDGSPFARSIAGAPGLTLPVEALASNDRDLWLALGGATTLDVHTDQPAGDLFWSRVVLVDYVPRSSLDVIDEITDQGLRLAGPTAIVAGMGARFHGQRNRVWMARPGNLQLAVALPLDGFAAADSLAFTLLPAVAACEAIVVASGGRHLPGVKWVNDVWLAGRKVAGVITRTRVQSGMTDLVLLGIGINVASAPDLEPTPFVPAAGHLPDVELPTLLHAVLAAIARRHHDVLARGLAPLVAAYRALSVLGGRRVRVYPDTWAPEDRPAEWPAPLAAGVVRAIRDDLALDIEGAAESIARGRLAFEDDCLACGLPPL